ncbi:ATP phosphoribosyltransferase [Chloroflexota bacterium]
MQIKIALPKGRLLGETAALLEGAGWGLDGYHEKARLYRLKSHKHSGLSAKIFHEKDVPIQVAVGNYDMGICGLDWIEELLVKYPSSALVKVRSLGYGQGTLHIAASRYGKPLNIEELKTRSDITRIASEYPNLAESFALKLRLRRFSVFPVWGAAEAYPPESSDLVLLPESKNGDVPGCELVSVSELLGFNAFLVANKTSWETKDMGELLAAIHETKEAMLTPAIKLEVSEVADWSASVNVDQDTIRLALPDGHQQTHTHRLLKKAGIEVDDYPSPTGNRRPTTNIPGVIIKVIRPQDMPLQVANGNFDLAISGKDWLREHLYKFPASPVRELLDLRQGKVRMVAVVSKELSVSDIAGLRQVSTKWSVPLRVASEYVNIADKYARDNHLGFYRVIPTWGATEAFLPEDADMLIENTETGQTIARHNLEIIDTLFESTACLIGNNVSLSNPDKAVKVRIITEKLRTAVEED